MKGKWTKSDLEELIYLFRGEDSSGGCVILYNDGTVEFLGTKSILEIRNIGSCKEEIVVKNAADLVL